MINENILKELFPYIKNGIYQIEFEVNNDSDLEELQQKLMGLKTIRLKINKKERLVSMLLFHDLH